MATSFYNDRDSDIAETLVKTLLETRQKVPDFLEQHIPEGFDNDGNGDVTKLHFDADSEDEAEGGDSGDAAGGWGVGAPVDSNTAPAAIEWGTSNESTLVIPATGGWSAPTEAAPAQNVAPSGWAAPLVSADKFLELSWDKISQKQLILTVYPGSGRSNHGGPSCSRHN